MAKVENKVKSNGGRILAATPDDEIVVSGISGRFPSARNVSELAEKLYNKVDMVTLSDRRYESTHKEIPPRLGVIDDIEKFDATFFGVSIQQTNAMDPKSRMLIETAYEAILDAGVCPKTIRGSKTGVFVGNASTGEVESSLLFNPENMDPTGLGMSGISQALLANRVSYCLGLVGPSMVVDSACASSLCALDLAFSSLRNNECDAALVGGANICLHPLSTMHFARLGVISKDGYCRPFDHKGSGFSRSEAVCMIYLQRKKNAKRIYANVIYSKTNCDGFKAEGILCPSSQSQQVLLTEFYEDIQLDPTTINYIEAHGTGTIAGDPEECDSISKIFCRNRNEPLLIGSLKSNMGHAEATSGMCSLAKAILIFENGKIPPNINFEKVRPTIPSLVEKQMIVCTDTTPLKGDKIGINCLGWGGTNAHALLSMNSKWKINHGIPKDNIPRLVNWAGRTEEAVETILNSLESQPLDAEFIALLHSAQSEHTQGNLHRGFTVVSKNTPNGSNKNALSQGRATKRCDENKLPIVWLFNGMGSQWPTMGKAFMVFPEFRRTVEFCHNILEPFGINLLSIITTDDAEQLNSPFLNTYVGITCVQMGLVNLLRMLNVPMDYCIGYSMGEMACAYADGAMTAEQTILAAFARGAVSSETKVPLGSMAAVGLGYKDIVDMLPPSIEVSCHFSGRMSTISGPKADVTEFINGLDDIFVKEVPSGNIAFHSRYIADMGPKLLERSKKILPQPLARSDKWLSTSVPISEWHLPHNKLCSAEYLTNNLLGPVLFEESSNMLPDQAIVIDISPHGQLKSTINDNKPEAIYIPLSRKRNADNAVFFLNALGKLFLNGLTLPIERLYPKVEFPVSRGTPMISPLIKWDHTENCFVMKFSVENGNRANRKVTPSLVENKGISEHKVNGHSKASLLIPSEAIEPNKTNGKSHQDSQLPLIKRILEIMRIRDIEAISKNSTFAELGMDSFISTEIKRVLSKEFDVIFSINQLKLMTFSKLEQLTN